MSFFKSLLICMSIGGIVGVIAAIVTVCTKKPSEWMPKKKEKKIKRIRKRIPNEEYLGISPIYMMLEEERLKKKNKI